MSAVFVDVGMSLDGFIAGPNMGPANSLGGGGLKIHDWMFAQKSFREHLGMDGGEPQVVDHAEQLANTFIMIVPRKIRRQ
jgi:hypothetical protein